MRAHKVPMISGLKSHTSPAAFQASFITGFLSRYLSTVSLGTLFRGQLKFTQRVQKYLLRFMNAAPLETALTINSPR